MQQQESPRQVPQVLAQPLLSRPPPGAQGEAPTEKQRDLTSPATPHPDAVPPRAPQLAALIRKLRNQRSPGDKCRESPGFSPAIISDLMHVPRPPSLQGPQFLLLCTVTHLEQEPPGVFMQLMETAPDVHKSARRRGWSPGCASPRPGCSLSRSLSQFG